MYADRETLVREICARLSTGEPMAQICRDLHMPAVRTVADWAAASPDISANIAHAREVGWDVLAAQCLVIADTPMVGIEEKVTPAVKSQQGDVVVPETVEVKRGGMLGHRKLQIETRLETIRKVGPKTLRREATGGAQRHHRFGHHHHRIPQTQWPITTS
ncbi:hypothetical protein [Rhodoferax sp.]|uniref:terminase small subunit-like protein n=1 Tax=Rhodoferax sp. TaxID=50421 RepID=UPI002ACE53EB|nr:hypothetical protein [Rhodoferax sp.]MDZ7918502.1 hypothetical protein [Rhodoferax sp.]